MSVFVVYMLCVETARVADVVGSYIDVCGGRIISAGDFIFHLLQQNCQCLVNCSFNKATAI